MRFQFKLLEIVRCESWCDADIVPGTRDGLLTDALADKLLGGLSDEPAEVPAEVLFVLQQLEPTKEDREPNLEPADTTTWEPSWSLRRFIFCQGKRPNSFGEEGYSKKKERAPLALFEDLHTYVNLGQVIQRNLHLKTHVITWRKRPPRLASFYNSPPQVP